VSNSPDRIDTLTRARDIIAERGWGPYWSTDDHSRLNIRSAVAKAASELVGMSDALAWYNCYLDAVHAIGSHLSAGVLDWESKVRQPAEVEAMLSQVINRLENDDIKPRASRSLPRPHGV
jgi:hypothetical protein